MENNFWQNLRRPFYALAPMAGITDSPFRLMCLKFGADVLYSEMASVNALTFKPEKTLEMLVSTESERPYVVQLFGSDPRNFAIAARLITEKLAPDGIDINFGCPVKKIERQGAGAVLMDAPLKARDIIKATIDNTDLPVSIKTRAEAGSTDVIKFLKLVNALDIKALMIHGRTMKQGFSGPIDTKKIKEARQHFGGVLMANGGIFSRSDAQMILAETEADGLGIAQGALGRPWLFSELKSRTTPAPKAKEEIFSAALEHAGLVQDMRGSSGMIEMRKHLCWYVKGLQGAGELRNKLIHVNSYEDAAKLLAPKL